MRQPRLAVVHQLPVERYPPVLNLLQYIRGREKVLIQVVTCPCGDEQGSSIARTQPPKPVILRMPCGAKIAWKRWLKTLIWHWRTALALYRFRPDIVLCVEPHSALAVWVYLRLFHGRSRLFMQYYEYYAGADYQRAGNRLLRFSHPFERSLLRKANRVTQTNADRMRLFAADHPELRAQQLGVWPNYPPRAWFNCPERQWPVDPGGPLRLVLVGAVSLRDTYIGSVVEWVTAAGQYRCTLDIYASSCDVETATWLRTRCGDRLRLYEGGVAYSELPYVLRSYDIGLILYKCRTVNFVYNATNKLFEYLVCGLDVWYPACMLGVAPYARNHATPRVLETDFDNLSGLDLGVRGNRSNLPSIPWTKSFEEELNPLMQMLSGFENCSSVN